MDLTSSEIKPDEAIPSQYTCEGANYSPPLEWKEIPDQAQSLAFILDDPDAAEGTQSPFTHWVLYNLPADIFGLAEGFRVERQENWDGMRGRNSFGNLQYEGPCPPQGETHRYYFRLFALDQRLDLSEGATRAQLMDAMHEHVLDQAELSSKFSRP